MKLPDSVASPQDVDDIILDVRTYAKWFSHNEVKKKAGSKASPEPDITPAASAVIKTWHGRKNVTVKRLDKLLDDLEQFKTNAPIINITLAAPPSGDVQTQLIAWCRKNIAEDVLVTFRFNRTLLGGLVVRLGSHIYDWSFRRALLDQRDHFPEVLRRV